MSYLFEIGIKNAFKSKIRLLMVSLLMCSGLIVISFTIGISDVTMKATDLLEDELQMRATVTVVNQNNSVPLPQALENKIRNIPGVQSISRDQYISGRIVNKDKGLETDSAYIKEFDFEHQKFSGVPDYRGKSVSGVLIPTWYSELVENDTVKISFDYMANDESSIVMNDYKVVGVYEDNEPEDLMQSNIYLSTNLYDDLVTQLNLSHDSMSLILYIDSMESADAIIKKIEDMGFNAFANDHSAEDYLAFIKSLRTMGIVVGLIMVGLSAVIVFQALGASIRRREKNIGLMKAFGYKDRTIIFMILTEISVYALLALILSIIVSMMLSPSISRGLSDLFMDSTYSYSSAQFFISLLIVVVFIFLSIIRPGFICRRLNPIDVLKDNG